MHETCLNLLPKKSAPLSYPSHFNPLDNEQKKEIIEHHFRQIMKTLGLDLEDDSLKNSPSRVAKMYVDELFYSLNEHTFPKVTLQENKCGYNEPLIQVNICCNSICEHHFVPILGVCHIAYIPGKSLIGLSKLNRITDYFAKRPQVQERLTKQITQALQEILDTEDVATIIDARHLCVTLRGIKNKATVTRTQDMQGAFLLPKNKEHLLLSLPKLADFCVS